MDSEQLNKRYVHMTKHDIHTWFFQEKYKYWAFQVINTANIAILVDFKNVKKRPWTYHSNLNQIILFAN
jgi:hypothetical protein